MNKSVKVGIVSVFTVLITGCVSVLSSLTGGIGNASLDTTGIVAISYVKDAPGIEGEGIIYFKNISTGKENSLTIFPYDNSKPSITIAPGTYRISRWVYNACKIKVNSMCKEKYDFNGVNLPIKGNTFTVKKGEIVYLGRVTINSIDKTLNIINKGTEDIVKIKKHYQIPQNRIIKNISNQIKINNWKFKITGAGLFG